MNIRTSAFRGVAILSLSALALSACDSKDQINIPETPPPAVEVVVTPTTVTLDVGQTAQAGAVVKNATNQAVTWSSSDATVASVSGTGLVTGVKAGSALITATSAADANAKGQLAVTVRAPTITVTLLPATAGITVGGTQQLAINVGGTATQTVTCTSSATSIATVTNAGLITAGTTPGTAVITCASTVDPNAKASVVVTVTPVVSNVAITVAPASANAVVGGTVTFVANVTGSTNTAATWASSDTVVATVSSTGVATAKAAGTAVITATASADATKKATATLTVSAAPLPVLTLTPTTVSIRSAAPGNTTTLVGTVTGTTNTTIIWSSSDTTVATVSSTGVVTGIKPGTAVITATSAANTSVRQTTTVTVLAPPPAPSISIASLTQGGAPINPASVAGQIDATVNVSAVPENNVLAVVVLVDQTEICRQNFSQPLGTTQGVATINCPINTAALNENGTPKFLNGTHVITAVALNANAPVSPATEITRATYCPLGAQAPCVVTFNNANVINITWMNHPVSSTGPVINTTTGLLWHEGDIMVTARPALYTGGTAESFDLCLYADEGTGLDACATFEDPTDNAYVYTFTKADELEDVSASDVIVVAGTNTLLLVGGQNATAFNVTPTPAFRLDNLAPTWTNNFSTAIGNVDRFLGIGFTFVGTASGSSATATVISVADPYFPSDAVGIASATTTPTLKFYALTKTAWTALGTSESARLTAFMAGIAGYTPVTGSADLTSQLTNDYYMLIVVAVDKLGNMDGNYLGYFGVDLVRPTNEVRDYGAVSLVSGTVNPIASSQIRIRTTDEFSGIDPLVSLQVRAVRWFNGPSGVDTRKCLTTVGTAFTGTDATTGSIASCSWISVPLGAVSPQVFEASIMVNTTLDGFYQYEVRTVDRAGNVSADIRTFSYYVDYTNPTGGFVTSVNIANLGGTAIPADSVRSNTTITASGVVADNIEVKSYDVRLRYTVGVGQVAGVPFAAPAPVGTYGLPLTEQANVSATTPYYVLVNPSSYTSKEFPTAATFGVFDMADNFGFTANYAFNIPQPPRIPTYFTGGNFGLTVTPTAIAPTESTTLEARATISDLTITQPIVKAFFWEYNSGTQQMFLLGILNAPTQILTSGDPNSRTFFFSLNVAATQLYRIPTTTGSYTRYIYVGLADANNNVYLLGWGLANPLTVNVP